MRNFFKIFYSFIFCLPIFLQGQPPIKVGVLHSRTGSMAINEVPVLLATLVAIDEINQEGGINGRLLEAVIEDGASDPDVFSKGANLLLDQGVEVIFGTWTSRSRKAVAEVLEKRGGLLFYPVQFEGLEESKNVIYLGAAPNQQMLPAVAWALKNIGKKYYVVGSDYIYPKAATQILKDFLPEDGGVVIGEKLIKTSDYNFAPIVADIKQKKPDVIINLVNGDGNRKFFTLLENDPELKKLPIMSMSVTEDNIHSWNVDLDNHYLCWSYFQSLKNPKNEEFLKNLRKRIDPKIYINDPMEIAYYGVKMWADSARLANTTNQEKILKTLKGQGLQAPEGVINIDDNHYLYRNIVLARVRHNMVPYIVWRSINPIPPTPFPKYRTRQEWDQIMQEWYKAWGNKWSA
jgi:urea transport system substrate-binding protein